jgi:hypothetical protein
LRALVRQRHAQRVGPSHSVQGRQLAHFVIIAHVLASVNIEVSAYSTPIAI